jgi:hypothetical protein
VEQDELTQQFSGKASGEIARKTKELWNTNNMEKVGRLTK